MKDPPTKRDLTLFFGRVPHWISKFTSDLRSRLILMVVYMLTLLLMAEILHHLGCIKPRKSWDKRLTPQLVYAGNFFNHQQMLQEIRWKFLTTWASSEVVLGGGRWLGTSERIPYLEDGLPRTWWYVVVAHGKFSWDPQTSGCGTPFWNGL